INLIPLGVAKHMSLVEASALLSTYAGAGIIGNLFLGWLADRIGPLNAIIATALCQAVLCVALFQVNGAALLIVAGLLGTGAIPVLMLHSSVFATYFEPANVSRAMGLSYFVKMPITLGAPPFLGYLFDRTGAYELPFAVVAASLV